VITAGGYAAISCAGWRSCVQCQELESVLVINRGSVKKVGGLAIINAWSEVVRPTKIPR
jgi:hypothetical protein